MCTAVELIKCRLQVQAAGMAGADAAVYSGPIDVIKQTMKSDGVRGLWRGTSSTLLREIPGNMAWYGVYECMCKYLSRDMENGKADLSMKHHMLAGGFSGAAYWSAFYPADTVKSKLQTDKHLANSSFVDVFKVRLYVLR